MIVGLGEEAKRRGAFKREEKKKRRSRDEGQRANLHF